jgi:hypothetical protein
MSDTDVFEQGGLCENQRTQLSLADGCGTIIVVVWKVSPRIEELQPENGNLDVDVGAYDKVDNRFLFSKQFRI